MEKCAKFYQTDWPAKKKCYGNILTFDLVAAAEVDVRELHKARERAEVACVKL